MGEFYEGFGAAEMLAHSSRGASASDIGISMPRHRYPDTIHAASRHPSVSVSAPSELVILKNRVNPLKNIALAGIRAGLPWPDAQLEITKEYFFLKQILDQAEVDCVLDVGANRGQFASVLRKIGYVGQIISFEPSNEDFRILEKKFSMDTNWSGLQIALGDEDGELLLNIIPSMSVLNSLLRPMTTRKNYERVVQVKRLDHIMPEILEDFHKKRIFLKLDTQGYDVRCFLGSEGCMHRIVAMQSEISMKPLYQGMTHYLEALACYERAGFELLSLSVVTRDGLAIQEMNCLMRRRTP